MKGLFGSTYLAALLAALAFSLLFPLAVQADDDSGFYAGIGVHRSSFSSNDLDTSQTEGDISMGYMFSDRLGMDFNYYKIEDNDDFDIQAFTFSGVYKVALGDKFDVYGKLGLARTSIKATNNVIVNTFLLSVTDSDIAVGLGAKLDFGQHNILVEYNKFDPGEVDLDLIKLGYRFEF